MASILYLNHCHQCPHFLPIKHTGDAESLAASGISFAVAGPIQKVSMPKYSIKATSQMLPNDGNYDMAPGFRNDKMCKNCAS